MEKLRIGCWLPLGGVDETLADGVALESRGFDSVFLGDHLVFMDPTVVCPETWTVLSAIGLGTRRLLIGSSVIDPIRRHPSIIAQTLATIDRLTRGRAILGLGVGEVMNLAPYGIETRPSQERLREAVEYIRMLWSSNAKNRQNYQGKVYRMSEAFMTIQPFRENGIPIYLGGLTAKGRVLAGEIGDGWFPWFSSTKTYQKCISDIEKGARVAGRNIDSIDRVSVFYAAIDEDEAKAQTVLDARCRLPLLLERDTLRTLGHQIPAESVTTMTVSDGTENDASLRLVPVDVIRSISASSVEECIRRIEQLRAAGSTHVVIRNAGPDKRRVFDAFSKEVIPYFKDTER